jgi:DNA-binding protein Fis
MVQESKSMVEPKDSGPYEGISLEDAFDAKLEKFMKKLVDGEIGGLYSLVIQEVEKRLIRAVLVKTRGNQLKASKTLGINRNTLRKKMAMLEISPEKIKEIVKG